MSDDTPPEMRQWIRDFLNDPDSAENRKRLKEWLVTGQVPVDRQLLEDS